MWSAQTRFDLFLYTNPSPEFDLDRALLMGSETGIFYDWTEPTEVLLSRSFPVGENVDSFVSSHRHIHIFLVESGVDFAAACLGSAGDDDGNDYRTACVHVHRLLIEDAKIKKVAKVNLLSAAEPSLDVEKAKSDVVVDANQLVPHFVPNVVAQIVVDGSRLPAAQINTPPLKDFVRVKQDMFVYEPIVFFNEMYMLREHRIPINSSVDSVSLSFSFSKTSNWKFLLSAQMTAAMTQQKSLGVSDDHAEEDLKRMFTETNPVLLGVTMIVSMLHMVFEFLAFKNDIQFWKNNRSLEGLSVRTVFINCFSQLVIFLYLMDNETSWMVLISSGIGVFIEFWKINKVATFHRSLESRLGFRIVFKESYSRSNTRELDEIATKYLSYAASVMIVGYSIYSVMYETHKGWYSFILNTLVGFIYAFGFIALTPQLFINYKLKSVAHLPWRTFVYKFLNTFIDDLFAFIIKMPTLHRLACLRDDVVFLLLLYQRWIYPVDRRRTEHGNQEDTQQPGPGETTAPAAVDQASDGGQDESTELAPAASTSVQTARRRHRRQPASPSIVSSAEIEQ